MKTLYGVASVPADWPASAVCIGKFDGVHAGHRAVIDGLRHLATEYGLASVVVTFDRHPLALLAPHACPEALVSTDQKLGFLADTGVDATVVLEFTKAMADLPAEQFVETILVQALHARFVLVGHDFRFGAGGGGDVDVLERLGARYGFEVLLIDDVKPHQDRRVSSTWIRDLLRSGDVRTATNLLGHVPTMRGLVVHGAARGRELGFPTANLAADAEGFTPADGVYAGWLTDAGTRYPAAISIGKNPTFEGIERRQVEAYVLDETDLDLYDHIVDVAFVERIRGMVAYSGVGPLIEQIRDDVERVRGILTDSHLGA